MSRGESGGLLGVGSESIGRRSMRISPSRAYFLRNEKSPPRSPNEALTRPCFPTFWLFLSSAMKHFALSFSLFLSLSTTVYSYDQDVTTWMEISRPLVPLSGDRMAWYFAGMYSEHEWKVFKDGHAVKAVLK